MFLMKVEEGDKKKRQLISFIKNDIYVYIFTFYIYFISSNMLKIKEWEDAEYIVNDIETSWMRMPDTGEEKQVMKNVIIKHKGMIITTIFHFHFHFHFSKVVFLYF